MSEIRQPRSFNQLDAWLSIVTLFFLLSLSGFILCPAFQSAFPTVSISTIEYISIIPISLIPIIYLSFRYGWIGIADFFLRGSDIAVLAISLIIVVITFSIISLAVPYASLALYGEISLLPRFEYLITIVYIFLIGPFLEETLFRKYIYEIYRSKYGILSAILTTAFFETLQHIGYWDIKTLIMIFLFTVFLTLIYAKSRLGVSVIMHCLINFFIYYF